MNKAEHEAYTRSRAVLAVPALTENSCPGDIFTSSDSLESARVSIRLVNGKERPRTERGSKSKDLQHVIKLFVL